MIIEGNDFTYFVNGESKTKEEVKDLIHSDMTVTVDNLSVNFVSPKKERLEMAEKFKKGALERLGIKNIGCIKQLSQAYRTSPEQYEVLYNICMEQIETLLKREWQNNLFLRAGKVYDTENEEDLKILEFLGFSAPKKDKITELLEEVNKHQEQNGGRVEGMEFPFNIPTREEKCNNKIIVKFNKLKEVKGSKEIIFSEYVLFDDIKDVEKYGKENKYDEWFNLGYYDKSSNTELDNELLGWTEFINSTKEEKEQKVIEDWNKPVMRKINPNGKINSNGKVTYNGDNIIIDFSVKKEQLLNSVGIAYNRESLVLNDKDNKKYFDSLNSKIGVKNNENKLPIDRMITVQFPRAIEAIAKATLFGHSKYKETDKDFLNYQRVKGGSQTYADAGARHNLNKNEIDLDSGLPHIYHKVWNAMAELELWIKETEK